MAYIGVYRLLLRPQDNLQRKSFGVRAKHFFSGSLNKLKKGWRMRLGLLHNENIEFSK